MKYHQAAYIRTVLLLSLFHLWMNGFANDTLRVEEIRKSIQSLPYQAQVDTLISKIELTVQHYPMEAKELAQHALSISISNGYVDGMARSYHHMGWANYKTGDMGEAIEYFKRSLELYQQLGDKIWIVRSTKWIGAANKGLGKLELALQHCEKAIKLAEELGEIEEVGHITNNIGLIFNDLGHHERALENFNRALTMEFNPYSRSIVLVNLARTYIYLRRYNEAIAIINQSIGYCQSIDNYGCELYPRQWLAFTYVEMGNYQEGIEIYLEIKNQLEDLGMRRDLMKSLHKIGFAYYKLGELKKGISYLDKSLALANELNNPLKVEIHQHLAESYQVLHDYKRSLEHMNVVNLYKDSINAEEKLIRTEEMLTKYESAQKEKEIVALQEERAIQKASLQKQTMVRNLAIGGAIMAILALFIIQAIYKQKTKVQAELASKIEEINDQKTRELIHENEINTMIASVEGQEKERRRIAQELHDGVAGNLASIKLQLSAINESNVMGEELQNAIENLDGTYHEIRAISHHLIPSTLTNGSFSKVINDFLKDVSEKQQYAMSFNTFPEKEIDHLPAPIKESVYRIIQELMSNIIKHANATEVSVQLTINDGSQLNLLVEDSGNGFDTSKHGEGIGLHNIRSRVNRLSGKLYLDSVIGRGTIVDIQIPVA